MSHVPILPDDEQTKEDVALAISSTADWRRQKAIDFPNDTRNAKAAKLLDALALSVAQVPDAVIRDYTILGVAPDTFEYLSEAQSEALRQVGFWHFPDTAEELLLGIIEEVASKGEEFSRDDDEGSPVKIVAASPGLAAAYAAFQSADATLESGPEQDRETDLRRWYAAWHQLMALPATRMDDLAMKARAVLIYRRGYVDWDSDTFGDDDFCHLQRFFQDAAQLASPA
jgi:hypothetical protein